MSTLLKTTDYRELFNLALTGVIEQGQPSYSAASNNCKYELNDGKLKCGIGHCLTPQALQIAGDYNGSIGELLEWLTDEALELYEASADLQNDVTELLTDSEELFEFLNDMQSAHDDAEYATREHPERFIESFTEKMRYIARMKFGISKEQFSITGI